METWKITPLLASPSNASTYTKIYDDKGNHDFGIYIYVSCESRRNILWKHGITVV